MEGSALLVSIFAKTVNPSLRFLAPLTRPLSSPIWRTYRSYNHQCSAIRVIGLPRGSNNRLIPISRIVRLHLTLCVFRRNSLCGTSDS